MSNRSKQKNSRSANGLVRLASLLGRIQQICNSEEKIAHEISPLVEKAQAIIENLNSMGLSECALDLGRIEYNTTKTNGSAENHHQEYKEQSRYSNRSRTLQKVQPVVSIDYTSVKREDEMASIRAQFRSANTAEKLREIILLAEKYEMSHEIQMAQNLISKLEAL